MYIYIYISEQLFMYGMHNFEYYVGEKERELGILKKNLLFLRIHFSHCGSVNAWGLFDTIAFFYCNPSYVCNMIKYVHIKTMT